jgi:3-keto-5-aminohexanoate cleavage enzyme
MSQYASEKYPDVIAPIFQLFGKSVGGDARVQEKWNIPEKLVIKCAVLGTIWDREQNPNQPYTTAETVKEASDAIDAGACSIHLHVRDKDGNISTDRKLYHEVVDPLRAKYGRKVHFDGETAFGETFDDANAPIRDGLFESSAVNTTATYVGEAFFCFPPSFLKAQTMAIQDAGCKPSIAVYNTGDVDNADRFLIKTGVLKPPFEWIVVPGLPGCAPMNNARAMVESLMSFLWRIRDVDPAKDPFIVVSPGGRASIYLTALSIALGLHVRVGMEDTIWKYPHKDTLIKSNKELVTEAVAIARLLGREPATADEYRRFVGLIK